ncbi:MAG: amidohydrolase family protein [bacterium]
MIDLIFRNARIVDGSGGPSRTGDLGVHDGRITAIGTVAGRAKEEVDATDLVLAPGFIDPHTHLDAQLFWDPALKPLSTFGVTTIVTGNCGYTFAPIDETTRDYVVAAISAVEQIPRDAIEAALPFDWSSLAEYFERLDQMPSLLNHATMVGHIPVRAAAMGPEAASTRTARPDEIAKMVDLVREGLDLGALGFSTDQVEGNIGPNGSKLPGQICADDELLAIARTLGESAGPGLMAMANRALLLGREARESDLRWHQRLAEASGKPVIFGPVFDDWNDRGVGVDLMDLLERETRPGRTVVPQVLPRAFELWMRVDEAGLLIRAMPSLLAAQRGGRAALRVLAADSTARARLRNEADRIAPNLIFSGRWEHVLVKMTRPENADLVGQTLLDLAKERAVHPVDVLLDLAIEEDFETQFATSMRNDDDGELGRLVAHPSAMIGGSDAGAHVLINTDSCAAVWMLQHWVRERGVLALEQAVHLLTGAQADLLGFRDRGRLAPGMAADLVLLDADRVRVTSVAYVGDLPEGHRRLQPNAKGVHLSVVNGEIAMRDGVPSEARPGRFLRAATGKTGRR